MKQEAFCLWHNKPLKDVFEHEQDNCGGSCDDCENLTIKECEEDE